MSREHIVILSSPDVRQGNGGSAEALRMPQASVESWGVYLEDILKSLGQLNLYNTLSQSIISLTSSSQLWFQSVEVIIMSDSKPKVLLFDIGGVCVSD